ncbi:MAG: NTP transferase domain-containing protein [Methanoregula sp.]|jgi:adenosylcobinamide-phosphate guanylyltransferase|uniref:NTP transferase domain-containing protein n=1 Tax=Methanoregula sp. TaxID=2052170 RepID=UPI003C14430A
MRALIMAGGAGSRINLGEKPLILICGQPMIAYIIGAFQKAGCEPVVAVSPQTPMTLNWCRARGIAFCKAEGKGFVEDMVHAIRFLEEENPIFISVSDIPCITAGIVRSISEFYDTDGKDALSTWVPASTVKTCRGGMPYRERINGIEACPAGINILRGDRIDEVQDEQALLLNEPRLAINVNTRADLAEAESLLRLESTA